MKNRRRARGRIEALEKLCRAVLFASPIMPEVRSSAACVPPGTEESALIDATDKLVQTDGQMVVSDLTA